MICPFCKEEILDGAIKCKHCGSMLGKTESIARSTGDSVARGGLIKNKKPTIIIGSILVIVVIAVIAYLVIVKGVLVSGDDYIAQVKTGSLKSYPNQTIGESFDKFFSSPKWDYIKSDNNKNVVEFTGGISFNNSPAEAKIQFIVDKESFEVGYFGVDEEEKNLLLFSSLMEKVFAKEEASESYAEESAEETEGDEKRLFAITMGDMKTIGSAIESYITDWAFAPQVNSIEELNAPFFVPFYIKELPLKDAWGNVLLYTANQDIYSVASSGRDGKFEGFDQSGFYMELGNKDIIYSNGVFIYGPEVNK